MKKIMEQYATALIAIMVALSLFTLIFDKSAVQDGAFPRMVERFVESSLHKPNWKKSTGRAFDIAMNQISPVIQWNGSYELYAGQAWNVNDMAEGYDKNNRSLPISVVRIWTESFEEVFAVLSTDDDTICIEDSGIYWVLIEATDQEGNCRQKMVKLFVNER